MLLTLRWAVENVFQYFVSNHDDLKQASHLIARGEATRDEQIELGRLFERRLSSEREKYIAFVLERLGSVVVKSDLQPQRDEFDVMRLACLINRTDVDLFSEKVFDAAKDLSDDYAFAFNGPWAPYSFVSLSLFLND
jgi:hypothetical protein